ncbi:MAG: DNA translocase FtsK [Bacteroidota bacterium]
MRKKRTNPPKNTFKSPPKENTPQKKDNRKKAFSWNQFTSSFQDKRWRKIIGLLTIVVSLYMFLSFSSYLFNWQTDDDILRGNDFNWQLLTNKDINVQNLMGRLGAILAHLFIKQWFGISSFLFSLVLFVLGFKILTRISLLPLWKTIYYSGFSIVWISVTFGFLFSGSERLPTGGILSGVFGYESTVWLNGTFGMIGTGFILFFTMLSFLILVFNLNQAHLNKFLGKFAFLQRYVQPKASSITEEESAEKEDEKGKEEDIQDENHSGEDQQENQGTVPAESEEDIIRKIAAQQGKEKEKENGSDGIFEFNVGGEEENSKKDTPVKDNSEPDFEIEIADDSKISNSNYQPIDDPSSGNSDEAQKELGDYDPTLDLGQYRIPGVELLDDHGSSEIRVDKTELEANKNKILETLKNYSINIDRIKATIGPTVTLYEIVPAAGVRISKIRNLEDDIALSLAALGIRIIAPIPGKGTIGIEVPNSKPEIVPMKTILNIDKYRNSSFELPIALGKTIANETFIADLTKMPHLLMAGATGQGKSVGLNAILASILYKKHPAYVKFVLVDPKKVELTLFSKIERHFLAKLPDSEEAIITDTRKVVRTLNSLCIEMDNRYDLLKNAQVRNIKEYNTKFISRKLNPNDGHQFLPYIVLIIDEFADLIMTAGKEIELPIARLAQLARAVGIHLIIATQRPSVNIITGMIKANFPARIAFRVTSKIDSRTILDTGGADQLIGRGDMLLSTGSDLLRLQCAFIDTPEIDRITDFIGSQRAYPEAFLLPEVADEESGDADDFDPSERDDMFEDAARVIVATQQGSTSLIQRKLKLGYNRAGRIIDQLEAAGIVGPFEGSKAREVRIKDEMTLEQILRGNKP